MRWRGMTGMADRRHDGMANKTSGELQNMAA
jgi:hypothetical protein